MNKSFVAIVIAMFAVFGGQAFGQVIPKIELGDATLQVSGYTQIVAAEGMYHEWDATWSNLRVNLDLNWDRLELFTQLNLATCNDDRLEDNWLRLAYAKYKVNEDWAILAGRLFISGGYSIPNPYDLRTVKYPTSMTFPCYAWGVQAQGKLTNTISLMVEMTGKSGTAFDAEDIFDRTEFGFGLKKHFGKKDEPCFGWIAGYGQFYSGLQRYGADACWQPTEKITLLGGFCYTKYETDRTSDEIGGYVLAAYKPLPWLELHSQLDWTEDISKTYHEIEWSKDEAGNVSVDRVEYQTSDAKLTTWTTGVKLMETRDAFSITVDYEVPVDDSTREPRWLAKAQVKF